jgi:hypothetical protein
MIDIVNFDENETDNLVRVHGIATVKWAEARGEAVGTQTNGNNFNK